VPSLISRGSLSISEPITGDATLPDHPVPLGPGRGDYRRESSKIKPDPSNLCPTNFTYTYYETNYAQIGSLPVRIDRSIT